MMRRVLGMMILALSLAGCSTLSGWFGGETSTLKPAALTRYKETVSLTRAWHDNVGKAGAYVFSPATDGKAVYAAGKDGMIAKLDLATGREVWRVNAGQELSAGVGVGAGLVMVGTPKGTMRAYHTDDGRLAWSATLSGEILVPPVAADGMVAVRSNDGNVWLLDASDGKQRWVYNRLLPSLILRTPSDLLLADQALFVGYPGGTMVALDLSNGSPYWETSVSVPKGTTALERITDVTGPLASDSQRICAAAYQGRVGCFDLSNGSPIWVRNFSSLTGIALDGRHLYADDEHGMVQGYEASDGASLWEQKALRDRQLSTPLVVSNYVAVADYQGYVHLLDSENGALLGRAASDGHAVRGRMLALRSGLILQTADGGVYAFRIQGTGGGSQ